MCKRFYHSTLTLQKIENVFMEISCSGSLAASMSFVGVKPKQIEGVSQTAQQYIRRVQVLLLCTSIFDATISCVSQKHNIMLQRNSRIQPRDHCKSDVTTPDMLTRGFASVLTTQHHGQQINRAQILSHSQFVHPTRYSI